jgi:hypothetical protein
LDGHCERALVKVNILPTEAQDFALSKSQSYCYDPSASVPSLKGNCENLRDFVSAERLDLFFFDSRWLGDESWILGEIATDHCFVEGGTDRPVNLVGSTWRLIGNSA